MGLPGFEPGTPGSEGRGYKRGFPAETTVWKHYGKMIINDGIYYDNLETPRLESLIASEEHYLYVVDRVLSKAIRVRYEKGVLKPLEPVELHEGEELVVFIRKRRVREVLDRYVGLFGRASVEELKKYEEEAQAQ